MSALCIVVKEYEKIALSVLQILLFIYSCLFQSSLWSAVAAAPAKWVTPLFIFMQLIICMGV